MTMFVFCYFGLSPACFYLAESIKTPRCELCLEIRKQIVLCIICYVYAMLSGTLCHENRTNVRDFKESEFVV